jgi:hypothetical protein
MFETNAIFIAIDCVTQRLLEAWRNLFLSQLKTVRVAPIGIGQLGIRDQEKKRNNFLKKKSHGADRTQVRLEPQTWKECNEQYEK